MSKVVLADTISGYNLSVINSNFDKIEDALNSKVLYRDNPDGEPNSMADPLDMNGQRIINLPVPGSLNDAARMQDVVDATSGITNAAAMPFSPTGTISATNVQGAIAESDTENRALSAAILVDLADSTNTAKGDILIAVKRSEASAVATTQHNVNQQTVLSPFTFMSTAQIADVVNRTGSINMVPYVQLAMNALNTAGGGTLRMPAGKWRFQGVNNPIVNGSRLTDGVTLYSNITIQGDGDCEIALDTDCCYAFTGRLRSAVTSSATNLHDIHIRNIKFTRPVATFFQEQLTIFLDSCERFSIEDCSFIGWSGDAIMLGGILSSGFTFLQSIVKDGRITKCYFDGVNKDTRQAISIFTGENIEIDHNFIKRTTRTDMPGAIDIEPELTTDIVKNIDIHHNVLSDIGGFGGVIGCALVANLSTTAEGITIEDNLIHNPTNTYGLGFTGRAGSGSTTLASNSPRGISYSRNMVIGTVGTGAPIPFLIRGANGITMDGNEFYNCRSSSLIAVPSSGPVYYPVQDLSLQGNKFHKCKVVSGDSGISLISFAGYVNGAIISNEFIDSGNWADESTPTNMRTYGFESASAASQNLTFRRNTWHTMGSAYNTTVSPFYAPVTLTNAGLINLSSSTYIGITPSDASPSMYSQCVVDQRSGSATYDPPSLVDGAGTTTTVTVTGAALGDHAIASFSLNLQGITLTAWVSAADTVSVRFQNESGGTLDLASGTLRVRVFEG